MGARVVGLAADIRCADLWQDYSPSTRGARNEESWKAEAVEVAGSVVDAVDEQWCAGLIDDPVGLEEEETHGTAFEVGTQLTHLRKLRQEVESVVELGLGSVYEVRAEVLKDPVVNVMDILLGLGEGAIFHATREARC
jgi:hypothetical protein